MTILYRYQLLLGGRLLDYLCRLFTLEEQFFLETLMLAVLDVYF